MQTGTDSTSRQLAIEALIVADTLRETAAESGRGEEFVSHDPALLGMPLALPLALWLFVPLIRAYRAWAKK